MQVYNFVQSGGQPAKLEVYNYSKNDCALPALMSAPGRACADAAIPGRGGQSLTPSPDTEVGNLKREKHPGRRVRARRISAGPETHPPVAADPAPPEGAFSPPGQWKGKILSKTGKKGLTPGEVPFIISIVSLCEVCYAS